MSAQRPGNPQTRPRRRPAERRGFRNLTSGRRPYLERLEHRNLLTGGMDADAVELFAVPDSWQESPAFEGLAREDAVASQERAVAFAVWDDAKLDAEFDARFVGEDEPVMLWRSAADDETELVFAFSDDAKVIDTNLIEADVAWFQEDAFPMRASLSKELAAWEDEDFVTLTALGGENQDDAFTLTAFGGEMWDGEIDGSSEPMLLRYSAADSEELASLDDSLFTVTTFAGDVLDGDVDATDDPLRSGYRATDADSEFLDDDLSAEMMLFATMGPSPWQNLDNPVDVNADGWTTPFDALLVINRVSEGLSLSALEALSLSIFADVNGDRNLDATDAIHVINTLNGGAEGIGDAELSSNEAASRAAPLWYEDSRDDEASTWEDADWNQAEGDDADVELADGNLLTVPRLASEDESWDLADEDLKKPQAEDDDQLFSEDADWLLAELL